MADEELRDVKHSSAPQMSYLGNSAENWQKFKLRLKYYLEGTFAKSALTDDRIQGVLVTALG